MNYENFQGTIKDLISMKLKEIEEKEQIKVLHAVESGSRAWGFASLDSDYDVRFLYIRPMRYYLELQPKKDFIEWELNETLDINGWDLSKTLQHFHKSNATLFEWANAPIVYKTSPEWERIYQTAKKYFSCKSAMYHYYGTAKKNYIEHLDKEMVKYKKYFYVLRPLLACKWIEQKATPPPVLFQTLMDEVLEEEMKESVLHLLEVKKHMTETERGQRVDKLNYYIVKQLAYFKEIVAAMEDDRTNDWEALNCVFMEAVHCNSLEKPLNCYISRY